MIMVNAYRVVNNRKMYLTCTVNAHAPAFSILLANSTVSAGESRSRILVLTGTERFLLRVLIKTKWSESSTEEGGERVTYVVTVSNTDTASRTAFTSAELRALIFHTCKQIYVSVLGGDAERQGDILFMDAWLLFRVPFCRVIAHELTLGTEHTAVPHILLLGTLLVFQ